MATAASSVLSGLTGGVYTAVTGTALPTDVDDAKNAAFADVGYISDDGVVVTIGTDTNDIRAWQGGDLVRRVRTSHEFSVKFTMIETNPTSLAVYFGEFQPGTGGGGIASGLSRINATLDDYRGAWVLDVLDGVHQIRLVVPDGQVTDRGDISFVNGEAIGYEVTVTGYADVSGNKGYAYFEAGAAS